MFQVTPSPTLIVNNSKFHHLTRRLLDRFRVSGANAGIAEGHSSPGPIGGGEPAEPALVGPGADLLGAAESAAQVASSAVPAALELLAARAHLAPLAWQVCLPVMHAHYK